MRDRRTNEERSKPDTVNVSYLGWFKSWVRDGEVTGKAVHKTRKARVGRQT